MHKLFLILLLLTFIGVAGETPAQKDKSRISFGEIKVKMISGPDSAGDIKFSVKVEAHNSGTKDKEVDILVRGVDAEGFEIVDLKLKGKVKAGQKRDLTESNYANQQAYQSIVKWEIED
jgi:hypothetical protein